MELRELFLKYRRILNRIHEGGNIFYDKGRFDAYKIVALTASNLRTEMLKTYGGQQ